MPNAYTQEQLEQAINSLIAILEKMKQTSTPEPTDTGPLTKRAMLEILCHEGMVLEAYKDSKGIWTWGVGVTAKSGHSVLRYKDNPQTVKRVIEIYKWLLETRYLPDVLEAFEGHDLTEAQLAAAVSFHYNTGGIKRASWVASYKRGDTSKAERQFMNWRSPKEIIPRREAERDLFFNEHWTNDGKSTIYTKVNKPSYSPRWSSVKRVDISEEL